MNNTMRASAKNEMEKDFHKLMNNAVYGNTCENQRKMTYIHLTNYRHKAAKLVNKPHCLDVRMFDEIVLVMEMQKLKTLLTKPSYIGFAVLDLSKLHMLKYVPSLSAFFILTHNLDIMRPYRQHQSTTLPSTCL